MVNEQLEANKVSIFHSNMYLDYVFIIALAFRLQERYGGFATDTDKTCPCTPFLDFIVFFEDLCVHEISEQQLESYIQILFENDDTDMEKLWSTLGLESFLPD